MKPVTPAAASRWPRFDFTAPISRGRPRDVRGQARRRARAPRWDHRGTSLSRGLPRSPPRADARRPGSRPLSVPGCAAGFGAIRPFDRPSWFIAEPRTTARTGSPSRNASLSRLRITTPQPSPGRTRRPRSNAWQSPVGDSAPAWSKPWKTEGDNNRFTPAAIAISEAPDRRLWHARCTATRDDEHAVSTAIEGPRRSRKYESRFAMMLNAPPCCSTRRPSVGRLPPDSRTR